MRRRDHERIVRDRDKTIARLEQQNRELLDELLHVAANKPRPRDEPIPVIPPRDLELVEPGDEPDY